LLCRDNQRNNLYFRGIFKIQTDFNKDLLTPPKLRKLYINLTEYKPESFHYHKAESKSAEKLTTRQMSIIWFFSTRIALETP
jgi:hypothetical protein